MMSGYDAFSLFFSSWKKFCSFRQMAIVCFAGIVKRSYG